MSNKKNKHKKKQRVKNHPKQKVQKSVVYDSVNRTDREFWAMLKAMSPRWKKLMEHKDEIATNRVKIVEEVIAIFDKFDSVQLLGSIGLRLLHNVPNSETEFIAQIEGNKFEYDEDAEVIAEYAISIGTALSNDSTESPSDDDVEELYQILKHLKKAFAFIETPDEGELNEQDVWLTWQSHLSTINVRGDGYMIHVEQVFKEMFSPHNQFFLYNYGFSVDTLFDFCTRTDKRIMSKLGTALGTYTSWQRWKEWSEKKYGTGEDMIENFLKDNPENGIMGSFIDENPDLGGADHSRILLYQSDDYESSDKIFWIVPQREEESKLLQALAINFGDNAKYIADGEFKASIMNETKVYAHPVVKFREKYFCFTPLLMYRNMFLIAESLMRADSTYYDKYFRDNVMPIARDNYIERKVKEQMRIFLPTVTFESSVNYTVFEDGVSKRTELDILGISDTATYIIEVKAHELTNKDKVGIKGLKDKFLSSATEGSRQCHRAAEYIRSSDSSEFSNSNGTIVVDKNLPIYKIVVTFQHYSQLFGDFDELVKCGLMREEYRNTWIVSLFDLMVVADYTDDETEFQNYLQLHNRVHINKIKYTDELDLYGDFMQGNLERHSKTKKGLIMGFTDEIDEDYQSFLPVKIN